jgi:hypothetical protein
MPNNIGLNGGQPQKQTRFAPIYTGRWSSGIWTNRSPLRDANTNRLVEKYYGAAGDALIAGRNVEITNRLTLARRAGNSTFDSNSYTAVDRFEEFRMFGPNIEQINVMVDQANALYSLYNGVKSLVWTKSAGAGQSFMQSVGNSLYFGNGADNKKWLQTLQVWAANAAWNTPTTPFMDTFIIDPNGNIQQLLATKLTTITHVAYSSASNLLTLTVGSTVGMNVGDFQAPWGLTTATWLNGIVIEVVSATGTTVTANLVNESHADYTSAADTGTLAEAEGGSPVSGGSTPTWNTTVPSSANNFQGGITVDGTTVWVNRGTPVRNWGIVAPTDAPSVTVGSSRVAWAKNTFYSVAGIIIDSNGNVQQVTTPGISGSTSPTWATLVGNTTTDGSITWTMLQTAASLNWQAHTQFAPGHLLSANASGVNCLFQLQPLTTPYLNGTITAYGWNSTNSGSFDKFFPAPAADFTLTPQSLNWANSIGQNTQINNMNGAGEVTSQTDTGHYENWEAAIVGTIHIRVPGQYSFTLNHDDGVIIAFDSSAQLISGSFVDPLGHTKTAKQGYSNIRCQNISGSNVLTGVWNFPTAGDYQFEIDWTNWEHASQMQLLCNGQQIVNLTSQTDESGSTQPVWPSWSTSFAPNYPTAKESVTQYVWRNLGPIADYTWLSQVTFTLPNTAIIDPAGNNESPYRAGVTGTTAPTFATGVNQLTNDNPNLVWINTGAAAAPPVGTVSTFNGGWQYAIALVNTVDETVSNCGQLTPATGNFVGADGVSFAPGSGLPDLADIDPQADAVAIFRSTDGEATPFLIPGKSNSTYTVTLSQYLQNGYVDNATDEQLDNLIEGPIGGECTPPLAGAVNLTYHLNRIFFSVGNVVYWTSGPDVPVGNGVNGVSPLNFDEMPSLVKRIVPLAIGALVFTVSDIYLITGNGTASSPIQKAIPYEKGMGLLNYNALGVNGSIVGFYTTDRQFIVFDPNVGVSNVGNPIGDQLRLNNAGVGTSWNPATAYVTWHTEGEDQAWYISDGTTGWYRLMTTPAPETGLTWCPFAQIVGGCKAVQSVEVSPGVHKLLIGPTGTGSILQRDLTVSTDGGSTFSAYAVIGSAVFAQPGQVATISFITTESVRVGTPLSIGLIMDEALPYFKGEFEVLNDWVNDPPNLPESRSLLAQRFYLSELEDQSAACRHAQIKLIWNPEDAPNELLSLTVFGAYMQES